MTSHDEELLAELLLQWEELYERGQDSSPQELCRDCPHLIGALTRRIGAMKATDWLNNPDCPAEDSTASPATGSEGKVLGGRYRLDDLIAAGGFAEVWRAFDTELQRVVAIKLPKPNRLASATNFITEARRVARLKHPGIVPVFDIGTEGNNCFIVSEYVEGGSLGDRLSKAPLTIEQTVRWLGDISAALEHAHLHGVIHRDVKPANILIDLHGRALLADFGIAQSAQKTGTFAPSLGTLRYMSPEQLEGNAAVPQSDVYSLGVVLHECLCGRLPYSSTDPAQLRGQILGGTQHLCTTVPIALRDVCQKAMKRLPHERHTSAAHFSTSLNEAVGRANSGKPWWGFANPLAAGLATVFVLSLMAFGIAFAFKLPKDATTQEFSASPKKAAHPLLDGGTPTTAAQRAFLSASRTLNSADIRQRSFADILLITPAGLTVNTLKEGAAVREGSLLDTFGSIPSELLDLKYNLLPKNRSSLVGIRFRTTGRVVIGTDWHHRQGFVEQKWTAYLAKQAVQRGRQCGGLELWDVVANAGDTVLAPSSCVVMTNTLETTQLAEARFAKPVSLDTPFAEVLIESARPMPRGTVGDSDVGAKGHVPEDLNKLSYAIHGTDGPLPVSQMALVITFKSPGRIAYLTNWRGGMFEFTDVDNQLMHFFACRRISEQLGEWDIWDIAGEPGESVVVPEWGRILAKDIEVHVTQ